MPQFSILQLSELESNFRLDSNYYLPIYVKNAAFLKSLNSKEIGSSDVSLLVTDGDHGCPVYVNDGVFFIKSRDLDSLGIDFSRVQKVAYDYAIGLGKRCKLNRDDVVISTVGTIGTVLVVTEDIPFSVLARDIAKVVVNRKQILPEYLFLFLCTSYGQLQMKRSEVGSVQQVLCVHAIKKMKIPIIEMRKQESLAQHVNKMIELKNQAKNMFEQAKNLLCKELEFDGLVLDDSKMYTTTLSRVVASSRFDAEFHQQRNTQIIEHLKKKNGVPLKKLVTNKITSGSTPAFENCFSDSEHGIRFIRATSLAGLQIGKNDLVFIKPETHNGLLARSRVEPYDVLFPIAGSVDITIGRCAVVPEGFGEANINQALAILRFNRKEINPYYAALFFSEGLGHDYINFLCRPLAQANINLTELENVLLPKIDLDKQNEIGKFVMNSHQKLIEAKSIFTEGIKITEEAIKL